MGDPVSLYGRGLYGDGNYSKNPYLLTGATTVAFNITGQFKETARLKAVTSLVLNTTARAYRARRVKSTTSVDFVTAAAMRRARRVKSTTTVDIGVSKARLAYIGYFNPSSFSVEFGSSAKIGEAEPLRAQVGIDISFTSATMKVSHVLRAITSIQFNFPLARFVMTRGYRTVTTVEFSTTAFLTRSATRKFTATTSVELEFATGAFFILKYFVASLDVTFELNGDALFTGPAWFPDDIGVGGWHGTGTPGGPWTPVDNAGTVWGAVQHTPNVWTRPELEHNIWIPVNPNG